MSSSPDDIVGKGIGRGRGRTRGRSISPRTSSASRLEESEDHLVNPPGGKPSPPTAGLRQLSTKDKPTSVSPREDTRGSKRGTRPHDDDFTIKTRPIELATKSGSKGSSIKIVTNYYRLNRGPMWTLYCYHVHINPEEDREALRKFIVRLNPKILGAYIFDGTKLYTSKKVEENPCVFTSTVDAEGPNPKVYTVSLKLVEAAVPGDPIYMQFYNIILRKCLFGMDLEQLGRHFYDLQASISIPSQHLELWPGYMTTLRKHENDVLLCVETTHKVLRLDNMLSIIKSIKDNAREDYKAVLQRELANTIVLTHYNRRTYRVSDVDFNLNPKSLFDCKDGSQCSYVEYYKRRWNLNVTDVYQPLLICSPTKKDLHRGKTGNTTLVPEFCQLTGLTDAMRANFTLMKELSKHLHMGPQERVNCINKFMGRLSHNKNLTEELDKWGLQFDQKLSSVEGRVLARENILFANGSEMADEKGDWTKAFRTQQMLSTINLTKWAVIVPQRDSAGVENLTRTMTKVAKPLNMTIGNPVEVFKLGDIKGVSYISAINSLVNKHPNLQMMFVILPNNKLETYATVKKRLAVEIGTPSQCFVAKNVTSKGLMSIATKVVVQMNAKLGGEPWTIKLPLKNLMVVGFDVYRGTKGSQSKSVGAMVSSLSPTYAKYFSTTSLFDGPADLSSKMRVDIAKCLHAYNDVNGILPDRIVLFRDGVGEGQLIQVFETELKEIQAALKEIYEKSRQPIPKFTFIVVTKKINSRLFADSRGKLDNPPPGTVVDDVITMSERYDFFLVSCAARQGTVSPCSYNVLFDSQGLDADKIQMLTYKMCHIYFNWSGTVAVPAPCQYAHKLAFITGTAYAGPANTQLSKYLHFL